MLLDDDDESISITINDEEIGTVTVFDPQPDGTVLIIGPGSPEAEDALLRPGSPIVDVSLLDTDGRVVQPRGNVEICLDIADSQVEDSGCLGFFDESSGKWFCEDQCLDVSNGRACGETDHFTKYVFALDFSFLQAPIPFHTSAPTTCLILPSTAPVKHMPDVRID